MTIKIRVPLLLAIALSIAFTAFAKQDVTGRYLSKFSDGVYWLQIVKTPDGRVSGELDSTSVSSDGKIVYTSQAVSGAADGTALSLTIGHTTILQSALTSSGTLSDNKIALTIGHDGRPPSKLVLTRATDDEYQVQLKALSDLSTKVRAAKSEREFVAGVHQLIDQLNKFKLTANAHITKLPEAEQRYLAITQRMTELLSQERQLAGSPRESVARSQLDVAINQGSVATSQLHVQIQSVQTEYRTRALPLMQQLSRTGQTCHRAHRPTSDNPIQPGNEAWNSTCLALFEAEDSFTPSANQLKDMLAKLEEVYKREQAKQEQILEEAQRLE